MSLAAFLRWVFIVLVLVLGMAMWSMYRINSQAEPLVATSSSSSSSSSLILKSIATKDFSNTHTATWQSQKRTFTSSTPSIVWVGDDDQLVMNTRYVSKNISINSRTVLDRDLNVVTPEIFLDDKDEEATPKPYMGVEDIRLFADDHGEILFSGNWFNPESQLITVVVGSYSLTSSVLQYKALTPSFVNAPHMEKNWVHCEVDSERYMIYSWYPLQIGQSADGGEGFLHLVWIKPTPEAFMGLRGSTPGILYNNRRWFVCHQNQGGEYEHLFAVFDLDMNLVKYSKYFKFHGDKVEFCLGLCMMGDKIYLSYSHSDRTTKIGVYDHSYVENELEWVVVSDDEVSL